MAMPIHMLYYYRAMHLDLVSDLSTTTFMRCFGRFTARQGTPIHMISENAKTFRSAAVMVKKHPKGLWRLGKIEDLIEGSNGEVHGV